MLFKTNKEARAFFIIASIPLILLFSIIIYLFKWENAEEYFVSTIIHYEHHGTVKTKIIDYKNHATKSIQLSQIYGDSIISTGDWPGLWEATETGDSLSKKNGDSCISLYKGKNFVGKFAYDFKQSGAVISKADAR